MGLGFLILGFIPLYVVNVFQRSGKEKVTLPYIVMLLVGIAIVVLFTNVNMSKNLLNIYRNDAIANEERVEELQKRTAKLWNWHMTALMPDQIARDLKDP